MKPSVEPANERCTDLELLAIQAEMSFDDRGRIEGMWGITIGCASEGQLLFVGSELPDTVAREVADAFEQSAPSTDPTSPPAALNRCRPLLRAAGGRMQQRSGPYYVFRHDCAFGATVDIERSDGTGVETFRARNPGNWDPDEWEELLAGELGPWAMAVVAGDVVSICHTPRPMSEQAAECGVWTRPDQRRRGFAATVTAAWAAILRPTGRHLFYSTDAENISSQRVAERLDLRPIGWTWGLTKPRGNVDDRHPLSRSRHR